MLSTAYITNLSNQACFGCSRKKVSDCSYWIATQHELISGQVVQRVNPAGTPIKRGDSHKEK